MKIVWSIFLVRLNIFGSSICSDPGLIWLRLWIHPESTVESNPDPYFRAGCSWDAKWHFNADIWFVQQFQTMFFASLNLRQRSVQHAEEMANVTEAVIKQATKSIFRSVLVTWECLLSILKIAGAHNHLYFRKETNKFSKKELSVINNCRNQYIRDTYKIWIEIWISIWL